MPTRRAVARPALAWNRPVSGRRVDVRAAHRVIGRRSRAFGERAGSSACSALAGDLGSPRSGSPCRSGWSSRRVRVHRHRGSRRGSRDRRLHPPPIAIGIAVLRYRLYEIDRIVSRTLGWATVTGTLVAVFAGAVVALQSLLAGVTQAQTLAVASSTLVAFALFEPWSPARARKPTPVHRARDHAARIAAAFAEQLREEVDLGRSKRGADRGGERDRPSTHASAWLRGGRA